jgi:uncharacterized membrane protein YgaE (UPF0421/DUF939 family)
MEMMTTNEVTAGQTLADDVLTRYPRARSPRARLRDAVDRLVGADPGLNQLRMALQAALGIGVGLGLAYLFVRLTGALQLAAGSAPPPARSAADHATLLMLMLLAGLVAMQATLVVQERTVRGQVLFSLLLPVLMTAILVLGLLVGPYLVLSLVFLVVALAVAVYLRRFGQRGLGAGMFVFFGAFFGFFLHTELALRDAGWILVDLEIGVLASLLVRVAFFRPDPEAALARMRRSQRARARRLLARGIDVLAAQEQRRIPTLAERIRRQSVRLNETTLIIDAQLADTRPQTAAVEAHRSFDAELALSNCARFAVALAVKGAPSVVRGSAAVALAALRDGDRAGVSDAVAELRRIPRGADTMSVLASRLAASVERYAGARDRLDAPIADDEIAAAAGGDFTPAVQLVGGWLPGSTPVSTEASTTRGRTLFDRATMAPYLRTSIQAVVAATLAVVAGYAVSAQRVYWAVLTVFVCFLQATNAGEHLRRAVFRGAGTAIGVVLGDLLVHLTGGRIWASVVIVLVSMFFGVLLIRVNYTFLSIAITVVIAQLYVQLGDFGWPVLLLRLAQTAVGVVAVIVTVLFIVPLRPQRVLTTGVLQWIRALSKLLDGMLDRLDGRREPLRPMVRQLDAAYAALVTAATPLPGPTVFGRAGTRILVLTSATRQYARSLAASLEDAEDAGAQLPAADDPALRGAAEQLYTSLQAIEHRLATGEHGTYVRAASLLALALDDLRQRRSPGADVLHDLSLLDGTLAGLAIALGMDVTDHDTGQLTANIARFADQSHAGPSPN